MTLIPKKLTFEDLAALFFGIALWLIYLYPVWKIGAFSHSIDWPTITANSEGVAMTTQGKWFFEQPHRFLTDAFNGDFPIFYPDLSGYLLNLLAKLTCIPPMVLQAIYVGPFLGFLYIVLNYYFLNKVFNNKRIALISSVLMAFMWHSRITDFYFTEYAKDETTLHVPYLVLMFDTSQSLGWILFVPTLCAMYLAYTHNSIQHKIYYGFLLGILLQTHILTLINILFINFWYLVLNNLLQVWKSLTNEGGVIFAFISGSVLTFAISFAATPALRRLF